MPPKTFRCFRLPAACSGRVALPLPVLTDSSIRSLSASPSPQPKTGQADLLPFDRIPSVPHLLPFVSSIVKFALNGGSPQLHLHCDRHFRRYGPIYRERLGTVDAVFISDADLIRQVFAQEDSTPGHFLPEPWLLYNQIYRVQRGLFFLDGDAWKQLRTAMNGIFLGRNALKDYLGRFDAVAADLASAWAAQLDESGDALVIRNLEDHFNAFSIEAMGAFVFGRRLGCVPVSGGAAAAAGDVELSRPPAGQLSARSQLRFQAAVKQIFVQSARMQFLPAKFAHRLRLPVWRRFAEATSTAFQLAGEFVEENSRLGVDQGGILPALRASPSIRPDELDGIVVDLFLASTDTTSQTLQWAMYLLAKHPEYQEKILAEVNEHVRPGEMTEDVLNKLRMTRAIMKETLRLYPVSPFLSRLYQNDIQVGGYEIPSQTMLVMSLFTAGRLESHFADAQRFRPERWIRSEQNRRVHSFAYAPFALGARSCIGRKLAESEIILLLAQLVKQFRLSSANPGEVNIRLVMITAPDQPIAIRLQRR